MTNMSIHHNTSLDFIWFYYRQSQVIDEWLRNSLHFWYFSIHSANKWFQQEPSLFLAQHAGHQSMPFPMRVASGRSDRPLSGEENFAWSKVGGWSYHHCRELGAQDWLWPMDSQYWKTISHILSLDHGTYMNKAAVSLPQEILSNLLHLSWIQEHYQRHILMQRQKLVEMYSGRRHMI